MAGDGSGTGARVGQLLARARRRARLGARTATAAGAALVVAVPLALAAVVGGGHAQRLLDQGAGSAWVVSPAQGLVTLVDGPSEEVAAGVRVPGAGHVLTVAQGGSGAYLVDHDTGTVARLDPTTYAVSTPVALGTPGVATTVLQNDPGPDEVPVVHVLDTDARTAVRVDPRTLAVRQEVTLTAQPGPDQAVVDGTGDLWAVDGAAGTLTRVTGSGARTVARTDAATTTARLVLVQGAPALVDPARGAVHALAGDARPGPARCLDTRPADDVQVLGSATRAEVYVAVAQARALLVASTRSDDCARAVDLGGAGSPVYGALAQSGRYVFVPEETSGTVAVVDTDEGEVRDRVALAAPGHRIELHARDGFVFFNDRDGEDAGVLTLSGGRWRAAALDKYDPTTGEGTDVVVPQDERPPVEAPDPGTGATGDDAPDAGPTPPAPQDGRAADAPRAPAAGGTADSAPAPGGASGPRGTGPSASGPAPAPTPAPALTVTLTTDPPGGAQPEVQPGEPATVVATVTGAGPGATRDWQVTSAGSQQPTFTPPAGDGPLVLDSVGDGDVTVRLTVSDGGRSTSAELVLWVKYACHLTINGFGGGDAHVVDLRAGGTASFTLETQECRGAQPASLTLPAWLSGPSDVTVPDGGASTTVDLTLVGPPPGDGPQPGATVTFTGAGPHTAYPLTVLTDVPPVVTDAEACQVPMSNETITQWVTVVVVEVHDATVGGTDRHHVTGPDGLDVPAADTSGTDRTYRYESIVQRAPDQPGPPPPPTRVTVTDGFGKTTGPVDVFLHPTVPSPCFGGG